jgi:DNA-binding transcriptional MerR regulator
MNVGELSKRSQVTPEIIRYYARIGLLKPLRNTENGYRIFSERDLIWLRFIRLAKRLGYTLAEIAAILRESSKGKSACPRVRDIIRKRIKENRNQLDELGALQIRMEKALARWEKMPNKVPNGESVCHLIESIGEL